MSLNERMNRAGKSTDPMIGVIAVSVGGGDQTLTTTGRGLMVTTAGAFNLVFQDASTATMTLPIGFYPFAIRTIKQSGTAGAGFILL